MANTDIKQEIRQSGIRFWEVASCLNVSDGTFSRKLRKELPDKDKKHIREIISALKGGMSQ